MKKIGEALSNTLNVLGVAVSVQDITNYLNLTLLIVSVINMSLILYFNIKGAIERAKQDGKVTKEEIEEITKITTEGVQEIKNKIDDFKEEK